MDEMDRLDAEIRDLPSGHLRRIIRCYHWDYMKAVEALRCARWLLMAQFALWCVWLA